MMFPRLRWPAYTDTCATVHVLWAPAIHMHDMPIVSHVSICEVLEFVYWRLG
jgi:hypothetical protein